MDEGKLAVWYGSMPESNGKSNFTAILHKGDLSEGYAIDRSEYPERVRYAADGVRYLIGELSERPWILDYDSDKHSGYAAPPVAAAAEMGDAKPLKYCAASSDGECNHAQCPQIRNNEPCESGRHCPLDTRHGDDE